MNRTTLRSSARPDAPDPWWPVVGVALSAVLLAATMERFGPDAFGRYFGTFPPTWAAVAVVGAGLGGLWILRRRGWLAIGRGDSGSARLGARPAAVLAALFALPVVVVDLLGGFGPAINVEAPWSLVFYPLMAVVAESVFHLAPLGVAAAVAASRPGGDSDPCGRGADRRGRGAALVAVALIEPALQLAWGGATSPGWAQGYVGLHVLAFNLVGLHLFRRYGLLTILGFRVIYYLVWHVAWGAARLPLLF